MLSLDPVTPKKLTTVTPTNSTTVPLKYTTEQIKFGAGNDTNTTSTPSSEIRPLLEQDSPWSYSSTIFYEDMAIESASKKRSNDMSSSVQENGEEDDEMRGTVELCRLFLICWP